LYSPQPILKFTWLQQVTNSTFNSSNYHWKYRPDRKYCALWSFPPLNAAEQKATPPPPVTIGQHASTADGRSA
jgi:hypothetical protein